MNPTGIAPDIRNLEATGVSFHGNPATPLTDTPISTPISDAQIHVPPKRLIIYHSADFDGIFCREIAFKKFGNEADYLGWDYGDPIPVVPKDRPIYMLDLCIDKLMNHPNLTWIDHHKTAIDKYAGKGIIGYRIDGVAACRLAWAWFNETDALENGLPIKEAYVNRIVREPIAVRLAGEYDIWDKRDPNAHIFQHGLKSCNLASFWPDLLDNSRSQSAVLSLVIKGEAVKYFKEQENEKIIKSSSFELEFEGFKLLACNASIGFNSHLFKAAWDDKYDGCLGFNFDGVKKEWRFSLYTDKPDIDLSVVAIKYGGGGHRGACGFRRKKLPFKLK